MEKYWALHRQSSLHHFYNLYFVGVFKLHIVSGEKADKDLQELQTKYTPYFMIVVFATMSAVLRYFLLPNWAITSHILLLLWQCVAFAGLWHLIGFINKRLNKLYPFERGPLKRMALQNLLTLLALTPLVLLSFILSEDYIPAFVNQKFRILMSMMGLVVVFMFNFAFYTLHFFGNWQVTIKDKATLEVQAAQLEQEKSQLQYHQLKNQVNPHYLFNMLSSLDGLVHSNPDLASDFIRHMSKVYRYVLAHKESEVVCVEDELEFIGHYIELLQIRYGKGLSIHTTISNDAKEKGIVMITLQMMIDNALKHNIVQDAAPLKIIIWDEAEYIVVHNNKQLRKQIETANGTGLKQLKHLYSYLTDKEIVIEENEEHYTIKIPLL